MPGGDFMPTDANAGKPYYRPEDISGIDYATDLGDPGAYPYTRGRRTQPRRDANSWILQELSGEGSPAYSNRMMRDLIARGAVGLDVIGDAPTMGCLDPDHPFARAAVGTQGVSICRLQDFFELYEEIPLDRITLSHSLPSWFAIAALHLLARDHEIPTTSLRGSVIQTPLYAEDYCYAVHLPVELRLRLTLDSIEFCSREMPRFHSFVEDTYYVSDGGPGAVDEMALGFVEIRKVVRELVKRGLDIDVFGPRIAILVNCRMGFFEEIAKIRASRRIFARMMREEFGAKDPRSWSANITAHTAGSALTAQQPANNVVRGAVQAVALALAGVQAMEISTFDEAYRTPSREAHLLAIRTQQIVGLETDCGKVADPLGGSYYVESLTNEMERRIADRIHEIEALGDAVELSRKGFFRQLLEAAMVTSAAEVQNGTVAKVGVNVCQIPEEEDTLLREVVEAKFEPCLDQIERIREFKRTRDGERVRGALTELRSRAGDPKESLIEPVIDALAADATIGEVSGAMRMAYGMPYDPLAGTSVPF
jgi:methylmalonyl-CoA mutase N-terminal domain/subunit